MIKLMVSHQRSGFHEMLIKTTFAGNKKRSQTSLNGPPSPVLTRSKTPILPLGTYSRPSKLEDWDPSHFNDPMMDRKWLRKGKVFFSPDDVGYTPKNLNRQGQPIYEMEDTSIANDGNEMADTSILAGDSEAESSSSEDSAV
jgi:hypothetical protein